MADLSITTKETNEGETLTPHYCKPCLQSILIFHNAQAKFTPSRLLNGVAELHSSTDELKKCASRCQMCEYIYSLLLRSPWISDSEKVWFRGSKYHEVFAVGPVYVVYYNSQWMKDGERCAVQIDVLVRSERGEAREVNVEMYTSVGRFWHRAIWSQHSPIDLESRMPVVRRWLECCEETHRACKKKPGQHFSRAARILDVSGCSEGTPTIRLISASDLDGSEEKYCILSYVRGTTDIDCRLTKDKLAQYWRSGIQFSALPATFKDAVAVTALLGIRFLWIDSLCIIQDDEQDWQTETSKVAILFHDAELTISATDALSVDEGSNLLHPLTPSTSFRSLPPTIPIFSARGGTGWSISQPVKDRSSFRSPVLPISRRAWPFQERLLSRRILHLKHSQLGWQCHTIFESENGCANGMHFDMLIKFQREYLPPLELHRIWWSWVAEYNERELSREKDKYAAFTGVVHYFQDGSEDKPLIGLWTQNLHLHLAWVAESRSLPAIQHLDRNTQRRPSWTWMTYPHTGFEISMHTPSLGQTGFMYTAKLLSSDISWDGVELTATPSGTIKLGAYRRRATFPINAANEEEERKSNRPKRGAHPSSRREISPLPYTPPGLEGKECEMLALYAYVRKAQDGDAGEKEKEMKTRVEICVIQLMVERVGLVENGEYVRIGCVHEIVVVEKDRIKRFVPAGTYEEVTLV